jgi:BirA family biotin operon repressor/biotin-[acetyl-CoA-carboxylase] ligase
LSAWTFATVDSLRRALAVHEPAIAVEAVDAIDSTNTELMRRARAGDARPVLLVAERQTAGRGRLGRDWQSAQAATDPAASLTFSLALPLAPRDWSGLSLAVGVSVAESLDPDGSAGVKLKWPNDLWVADRKLAGILIETASLPGAAATRQVVIGIGLNVGAREGDAMRTPPAWLRQWQPDATPQQALTTLAPPLLAEVLRFAAQGFASVLPRFATRDALRGREVVLSDGQAGLCEGIGPGGALRVRTPAGLQEIHSSEVSVRPRGMALP